MGKKGAIIKWIIIIIILASVCVIYRDFLTKAILEIGEIPIYIIVACIIMGMLYYVVEGIIISYMTIRNENRLSFLKGFRCGLYCAFYKLATLGSGAGIAQVYFYNCEGIKAAKGTGMMIVQYTFMKITIGILGILSFVGLIVMKDASYIKYAKYMLAGSVLIGIIITALIIMAVSKKTTSLVFKILFKIVKEGNWLYSKVQYAQDYVNSLQEQGKELWSNKLQFFNMVLLNVIKLVCWYSIPAVLFGSVGYNVNIFSCIALMSVVNMISGVMIAPAGIGTLEFVFVTFFGSIFTDIYATTALIIYRFFTWIFPFVVGAFVVGTHSRKNAQLPNNKL